MRSRPLFIAMIVLLLLRGWVGDAMAMQRGWQQVVAAQAGGSAGTAPMPDDCPMHAQAGGHDAMQLPSDGPSDSAHHSGGGCDSCELCLPLAFLTAPGPMAGPALRQPQPLHAEAHATKADVYSGLKPPIS